MAANGGIIAGLGEEVIAPALVSALQDPSVQTELETMITRALESEQTRAAVRPYIWEASAALGLSVGLGLTFFYLATRRRK